MHLSQPSISKTPSGPLSLPTNRVLKPRLGFTRCGNEMASRIVRTLRSASSKRLVPSIFFLPFSAGRIIFYWSDYILLSHKFQLIQYSLSRQIFYCFLYVDIDSVPFASIPPSLLTIAWERVILSCISYVILTLPRYKTFYESWNVIRLCSSLVHNHKQVLRKTSYAFPCDCLSLLFASNIHLQRNPYCRSNRVMAYKLRGNRPP